MKEILKIKYRVQEVRFMTTPTEREISHIRLEPLDGDIRGHVVGTLLVELSDDQRSLVAEEVTMTLELGDG